MSFWRDDAFSVNGFNEAFVGWGREDSEFVVRLAHAGLKRNNLKYLALVFHLYHAENSRNSLPQNDRLLKESIDAKTIRCEKGLTGNHDRALLRARSKTFASSENSSGLGGGLDSTTCTSHGSAKEFTKQWRKRSSLDQ
jgi:predicted glycosyltransferase involved in capsule biosynthesis